MKLNSRVKFVFKLASLALCFLFVVLYKIIPAFSSSPYIASGVIGQGDFSQSTSDNLNPNPNGFSSPYGVALDNVNHRLWAIDNNNSRVLGFDLNNDNTPTNDTADYVFGQGSSFNTGYSNDPNTGDASAGTLSQPEGIAIDIANHRLWVSDTNNSRVLGFNLNSDGTPVDTNADYVFGQGGLFTGASTSLSAAGLANPSGLALDGVNNRLWVSDNGNERIIYFNLDSSGVPLDDTADYVLGQSGSFVTQVGCPPFNANKVCQSRELAIDYTNHRLWVSNSYLDRVLAFDLDSSNVPLDDTADYVLGQAGVFTTFGCHSPATADKLCFANGLAVDEINNRLFVSDTNNNRVLIFNLGVSGVPTDTTADYVFGQGGLFTEEGWTGPTNETLGGPQGMALDPVNHYLYIAEQDANRLIGFNLNSSNLPDDTVGDFVFGQNSDFNLSNQNTRTGPNSVGFNGLVSNLLDSVNHKMFVADTNNNRVLIFNLDSNNNFVDKTADYVIGQDSFSSSDSCSTVSESYLCTPYDMVLDNTNHRLWVVDQGYNRILQYNLDSSNAPLDSIADAVLGQGDEGDVLDFSSSSSGQGNHQFNGVSNVALDSSNHRLFVSDTNNNRVVFFNLDSTNNVVDNVIDGVLGQPDLDSFSIQCNLGTSADINTLCDPAGLAIDQNNSRLFVSDKNNNRVLVFDTNPDTFTNGKDANYVLGQIDQFENSGNQGSIPSQSSLRRPRDMDYNANTGRLYITDERNGRITIYNVNSSNIATGMNAEAVLGAEDFSASNENTSNYEFANPYGVSVDITLNKLYVADQGNNRIMQFNLVNITKSSLSNGTAGNSYSDTVTASSSQGIVTYSIISGSLPPGLNIDSSTGAITGTPGSAGSYTFTVQVSDDNGAVGSFIDHKSYAINITSSGGGSVPLYILQAMSDAVNQKQITDNSLKVLPPLENPIIPEITIEETNAVKKFASFLRLSNRKTDVKELQIFLNSQGFILAKSGPGSPGNETNFFGRRTKAALIKYQEANKQEILKPLKLKRGTGFFGPYTMRFVNAILEKQN